MCRHRDLILPFGKSELYFSTLNQTQVADFSQFYYKHLTVATITCLSRCELELNEGGEAENSKTCQNGIWLGKWPKCKCPLEGECKNKSILSKSFRKQIEQGSYFSYDCATNQTRKRK